MAGHLLRAGRPLMMSGYYCILAFPLLVIVPFSAFRSLAAEREDGTYELLSITTRRRGRSWGASWAVPCCRCWSICRR